MAPINQPAGPDEIPDQTDACWQLIHTLFDWAPGPRGARSQALPGFRPGPRERACEDCLTNGRVMPACETCHGRGVIAVPAGPDPYEKPAATREQRFYGPDQQRRREQARARDLEIQRLNQQLGGPDHAPMDALTAALEQRDRQYRHGDYAPLERALQAFRDRWPALHSLLWRLEVCHEPIIVAPFVRQALDEAVRTIITPRTVELAGGRPLRVPPWLSREAAAAAGKESLWRGRSGRHEVLRSVRNEEIRRLYGDGWKVSRLCREFQLSRSQVYEILGARQAGSAA